MSREILFKGKSIKTNLWIYGSLVIRNSSIGLKYAIHNSQGGFLGYVIKETICQYTGFSDRNGVKIFDGDTIMFIEKGYIREDIVVFENGMFSIGSDLKFTLYYIHDKHLESLDVIGNIHDK